MPKKEPFEFRNFSHTLKRSWRNPTTWNSPKSKLQPVSKSQCKHTNSQQKRQLVKQAPLQTSHLPILQLLQAIHTAPMFKSWLLAKNKLSSSPSNLKEDPRKVFLQAGCERRLTLTDMRRGWHLLLRSVFHALFHLSQFFLPASTLDLTTNSSQTWVFPS